MTAMAYIIAGLCVLLAVAGMIWYAHMTGKGDDNSNEETFEKGAEK